MRFPSTRAAAITAAVISTVVVVTQFAIPPIAEQMTGDRLTEDGGEAEVEIDAFPALRLIFGDGGTLDVSATGLEIDVLDEDEQVMDRLDGFGEVAIEISDSTAGPVEIDSFSLTKGGGEETYELVASARTTPEDLVGFSAGQFGIAGALAAGAAGELLEGIVDPDAAIPIELDMVIESDDGRVEVTGGEGTVAGLPTGPLGRVITAAIVGRL